MRRRLRRQNQVREALLLDLGALVFELHRQGRREPELLQAKAAELLAVDEEVRALDDALDTQGSMLQLTAGGIAGSCSQCAAIMPLDARYCASCGAPAQVALEPGSWEGPQSIEEADPGTAIPPLPPQPAEEPAELTTEERAALEAGDFEQADPGPPVGDPEATVADQEVTEADPHATEAFEPLEPPLDQVESLESEAVPHVPGDDAYQRGG